MVTVGSRYYIRADGQYAVIRPVGGEHGRRRGGARTQGRGVEDGEIVDGTQSALNSLAEASLYAPPLLRRRCCSMRGAVPIRGAP